MARFQRTDWLTVFLLAAVLMILIEATFFQAGFVFSLFFGIGMIYFGRKWSGGWFGKGLLWIGILVTGIMILNMTSLRILLIAFVIYLLYRTIQSKKEPTLLSADEQIVLSSQVQSGSAWKHPFMKSKLFSVQSTPDSPYEWKDIHIQGILGDVNIDLSNTVLPKGTAVISVRQTIGKVKIDVPYEVPVRIAFTALAGNMQLFGQRSETVWNESFYYEENRQADQELAEKTVAIFISVGLGDIEVNRI
ncbi:lia operon protein LiaF [Bacillus ectoiniformans]|uniref:cell wall-active antibiotics response protein LiaF n=1 Tax=Bacillus ectoiniformans TaxID=1494429 RepID=UPI00195A79D3|nr:cell wall-active antibiotics response protein LiaF [Bacillus ectoiniformans]MBM7649441.1 lia operon protein LiaF [Bacillus ectoiniformans]